MRRLLVLGVSFLLGHVLSAAPVRELSTDWILRSIHDHHVTDIEQLLGTFQPDSLKFHLFAYGSESQQASKFLSPRVIVYSYDADFIMAFNGESGLDGFYDLEILRFDHQNWKFIPEVIHFDPLGKAAPKLDAHPTECARCHQTDIRPNWDPYFHWVNFYGSSDDNRNAGGNYPGGELTGTVENLRFADFLKKQQQEKASGHGRYRFLPKHPADRPNLHFNDRVMCVNLKRMVRIFASHPEAARLWPVVHGGTVVRDEIPEDLRARAKRTWDEVFEDTERTVFNASQRRLRRQTFLTGEAPKGRIRFLEGNHGEFYKEAQLAAGWRYLFEEILHEPFLPIATSRHPDYQLNLGAEVDLAVLMSGSHVDEKTGKFEHGYKERYRVTRSEQDYTYYCPVGETELDEPLVPPRD